jgi:chromosome segregation protein
LVEKEIEELLDQQMRIEKSIEQLQAEQDELVQDFTLLERDWQVNEGKLQDAKDAHARLLEQERWNTDRLLALDADMIEVQSMIESGKRKLDDIEAEINRVLGEEKKINLELQAIPLFEIQQTLNQLKTQQIVAKNTLDSVQQRYQDISNRVDVSKQRFQELTNRRIEIAAELVEIEKRKRELTQKIEEIQLKINHLETEHVEPLSAIGVETEQSIVELQQIEAQSHQKVIIAERQYTQLQMELERRQDQLNLLRDRIGDDFGLVSFEGDQKYDGPMPLPFNDDLIEDLPQIAEIPESHEDDIKRLKGQLVRIGAVNPEAEQEYIEVKERFEFLTNQVADLEKASQDLQKVIEELDDMMEIEFVKTYQAVNKEFSAVFSRLFNGGEAKLIFTDEEKPVEGGVDIEVRLPGRRQQGLASLSGGERSLTAVALIFALLKVSPPPFCILDEVDAMLDESNVGRFVEELRELSEQIQVVIITHNRNTVQAADVIYGVTMGRDSTSQMISLKLDEVGDAYFA